MPDSDHRSANESNITSDRAAWLRCTDDHSFLGIKPHTTKETTRRPRLLAIQEARPPLSQSVWPARPPEEGERGAGQWQATLNEKVGE
jgi:hypothetical protein